VSGLVHIPGTAKRADSNYQTGDWMCPEIILDMEVKSPSTPNGNQITAVQFVASCFIFELVAHMSLILLL